MTNALIGYTGFVGSNLDAQTKFDSKFNSTNIDEIDGNEYELVVCSATRAEKWRINQDPETDMAEINNLISHLEKIKTKKLILVSTVDVYKIPINVDEDTPLNIKNLHAYGKNRLYLEDFCQRKFNTLIVRLPGLFGPGLKKNIIYDLLKNNNVDKIHHAGSFQYYNLENIWKDIQIANCAGIELVNFATEPLRTDEIAGKCFGIKLINAPEGVSAGSYDMHTKHSILYGKAGPYLYSKAEVILGIKSFIKSQRAIV